MAYTEDREADSVSQAGGQVRAVVGVEHRGEGVVRQQDKIRTCHELHGTETYQCPRHGVIRAEGGRLLLPSEVIRHREKGGSHRTVAQEIPDTERSDGYARVYQHRHRRDRDVGSVPVHGFPDIQRSSETLSYRSVVPDDRCLLRCASE